MMLINNSAEMEMTVNILIQIDKLVQLIESPVFTCESRSFHGVPVGGSAALISA